MPIDIIEFHKVLGFMFFRVYWSSKSKCIISSNLRADGSGGEVQWETVGNSWGSYLWLGKKRANFLKPFKVHFLYSDCFRLFQFLWKACFTCGPLIQKNHNIQHTSSRPFCAQVARNDACWHWNPIYHKFKNPKTSWNWRIDMGISHCYLWLLGG